MSRYENAKNAPVGAMIACPSCNKRFKKMSYQHTFCSRIGPHNGKDTYWNWEVSLRMERVIERNENCCDEHPFSSEGLGQS